MGKCGRLCGDVSGIGDVVPKRRMEGVHCGKYGKSFDFAGAGQRIAFGSVGLVFQTLGRERIAVDCMVVGVCRAAAFAVAQRAARLTRFSGNAIMKTDLDGSALYIQMSKGASGD